jgi:hypothetical protein
MVSALKSREFGCCFIMLPEKLQQVNNARRGKQYKEKEVAISRLGTAYMKDLLKSPFIKELLFDHSCGRDKQREDGLNVQKMSELYGGKQPIICNTVLTKENGFFWAIQTKLQVGNTQCLYFRPKDEGPFWLTPEEQERKRFDVLKGGTKMIRLTKIQLVQLHKQKGIIARGKAAESILTIFSRAEKGRRLGA